ncbi:MAG: 30S ribosomal protein S12 methylthiotransferase RimO [Gemmatimonadales bacterium]
MKLGVISLGCDKATVDSERLVGDLIGHGARLTEDLATADLILVNTCGFIDAAKQESVEAMLRATALKQHGRAQAVVAVGCLIERYKEELQREIPELDLALGFGDLHKLVPALAEMGLVADPVKHHPGSRQFLGPDSHIRYLKISEGCDHTCAFCAIPLMRGRHRSEPLERLVKEAQLLEEQGAREVSLVAQDLGHYGRDLGRNGPKLPELLEALLEETTIPWLRLLYVYSLGLTDRLIELMANEPRIVPYIDIPIQHASDAQLERMRRPERQSTIREKVLNLRKAIPEIAIRTTTIVGFPGETDGDFETLCEFASEMEFERLGVFTYSPQEGTRGAEYDDDVPDVVKRARQEELLEIQRTISEDRLSRYVGNETEVLVDRVADPDEEGFTHVGRVKWQADDVDGVTYVRRGGWARPGDFVRVKLEDNVDFDFHGVGDL